ncbi:MAG: tetratricopeptide repeat protein [Acidobacteriota bacterium]
MAHHEIEAVHAELRKAIDGFLEGQTPHEAIGLDSDRILAMALYAHELADQGRPDSARLLLQTLAGLEPDNAYLHSCLGALQMQMSDKEEAVVSLRRALDLDPNDIAAATNLGELALEKGDLESAAALLERAVTLDPEGRDPHANRARSLAMVVVAVAKEIEEKGPGALDEIRARIVRLENEGHA